MGSAAPLTPSVAPLGPATPLGPAAPLGPPSRPARRASCAASAATAASTVASSRAWARSRAVTFALSRWATSAWPPGCSGTLEHAVAANAVDVLADLQSDAERVVQGRLAVERQKRPRPRDRLPHAGQLVELALPQPRDRGAHARGHLLRHAGQPRPHDLGLTLGRRVV